MENLSVASAGQRPTFADGKNSQSDRVRIRPSEHEADPPPVARFQEPRRSGDGAVRPGELPSGDNGTGKTNVLDAVHYLGNAKGYFNPIDSRTSDTARPPSSWRAPLPWRTPRARWAGPGRPLCTRGRKSCSSAMEGVRQARRSRGALPVVMIAPSDSVLVLDGAVRQMDGCGHQPIRPSLSRPADPIPPPRAATQHPLRFAENLVGTRLNWLHGMNRWCCWRRPLPPSASGSSRNSLLNSNASTAG